MTISRLIGLRESTWCCRAAGLFGFLLSLFSGEAQVRIDPGLLNPPEKPGYQLILADEFDFFNPLVWDKSSPGDDNCAYAFDSFCNPDDYNCAVPKNESNVPGTENGHLLIQLRQGEDQGRCDFSSGEAKSTDVYASKAFAAWNIAPHSWVEIRVRFPECYADGVGCAGWLYRTGNREKYSEIDIWEVHGRSGNRYEANFHSGQDSDRACHRQSTIAVKDLQGRNFNLSDHFLTFGVAWDWHEIRYYLNNQLVKTVNTGGNFGCGAIYPYYLRLNTGKSLHAPITDCRVFPQFMEIDYVRVYKRASQRAIRPLNEAPLAVAAGRNGSGLYLSYYPGVVYDISLPADSTMQGRPGLCAAGFDAESDRVVYWIVANQGTPAGPQTFQVTATFPGGYREILDVMADVSVGMPPLPARLQVVNDGFTRLPSVPVQPNTSGYAWSMDGGAQWQQVPNAPGSAVNYGPPLLADVPVNIQLCVRAYNAVGLSDPGCFPVTLAPPATLCTNCITAPLPPRDIEVVPSETAGYYTLRTRRTLFSTAYQWSYDQEEWYLASHADGAGYNSFGNFAAGAPTQRVYVRAVYANDMSEVYAEEISFPLP